MLTCSGPFTALTNLQINTLANRKGVRRVGVENFLGTMGQGEIGLSGYRLNLRQDARDYQWNMATQNAIETGIAWAFGQKPIPVALREVL